MAQLTQASIEPHVSATRSAACSTACASETSAGRASAVPPAASTSALALPRRSAPRAIRPMLQPCLAKAIAVAPPAPAEAPVMPHFLGGKWRQGDLIRLSHPGEQKKRV